MQDNYDYNYLNYNYGKYNTYNVYYAICIFIFHE